jgi:hypothetical protein
MKKDTNWISYVGPADDGRTIGPDDWHAPKNPLDYDDLVKCSDLNDFIIEGLEIPAGREDSIDCVRGRRYIIRNCVIHGTVTLKGAIDGYCIENSVVSGTIEIGQFDNYWTPGRLPTRHGVIKNVISPDGTPVRVKLWDATHPLVLNSKLKITIMPRWVWLPYFFLCLTLRKLATRT